MKIINQWPVVPVINCGLLLLMMGAALYGEDITFLALSVCIFRVTCFYIYDSRLTELGVRGEFTYITRWVRVDNAKFVLGQYCIAAISYFTLLVSGDWECVIALLLASAFNLDSEIQRIYGTPEEKAS